MSKMVQVSLSQEAWEVLQEYADSRGVTLPGMMRIAFREYAVKRGEKIAVMTGKAGRPRKSIQNGEQP